MNNSKVLLFGSFTEDETKSLLLASQSHRRSAEPLPHEKFQFGFLNIDGERKSHGKSFNGSNNNPSFLAEETEVNHPNDLSPGAFDIPIENGSPYNHNLGSPHTPHINGISEVKPYNVEFPLLDISHKENGSSHPILKSKSEDKKRILSVGYLSTLESSEKTSAHPATSLNNLIPRGLVNRGNLCFLSSTLQALLCCTPFVQLLQDLKNHNIPKVDYPTLTSFVEFLSEFDMSSGASLMKKDSNVVDTGRPFSPVMFEAVLKNFTPDLPSSMSGCSRQEDAQEFLSFVMDQMHDELLKFKGFSSNINGGISTVVSSAEDGEWETVGRKNKSAVTRTQSFVPSELSDIFGGQLRSMVKAKGNKASATVQPYLLLHLDIYPEAVRTIEDALHLFSAPEPLEGYRSSGTGKAGVVSASRTVKIQKLSKIMILHLKRFGYGNQGSTKLHKPVHFPLELVLSRDFFVSPSTEGRKYELVATITHHGRESSKGHYTADARYHNGQWLRFDDASVTAIGTNKVLHDQAYVLFYEQE